MAQRQTVSFFAFRAKKRKAILYSGPCRMNYKGHVIKERYKNETKAHPSNQILIQKLKDENWTVASQIARNDEMFIFIEDPEGRLPLHYVVELVTMYLHMCLLPL